MNEEELKVHVEIMMKESSEELMNFLDSVVIIGTKKATNTILFNHSGGNLFANLGAVQQYLKSTLASMESVK